MEFGVAGLVLLSALMHAGWNAAVKQHGDHLVLLALIMGTCSMMGLVATAFVAPPSLQLMPYLVVSMLLHALYHGALLISYRHGDLSVVYPIARGIAPAAVALLSSIWAGEVLSSKQWLGVALVSVGIMCVGAQSADHRKRRGRPILAAVITGAIIASYTFLDGLGTRVMDTPATFMAWQFFLSGLPICAAAVWLRWGQIKGSLGESGLRGIAGGMVAGTGYAIVLWALSRAPMGFVASLRETGVVFAAVLGTWLLKEPMGNRRIFGAFVVAAGIGFLSWMA